MQRSPSSHHKNKNKITPRQIFIQKSAPPVTKTGGAEISVIKPAQSHPSHHRQSHHPPCHPPPSAPQAEHPPADQPHTSHR